MGKDRTQYIDCLIARFFDGETTPEEEKELYSFFCNEDIPEEYIPLKEMFRDFSALQNLGGDGQQKHVDSNHVSIGTQKARRIWLYVSAVAASLLLLFMIKSISVWNEERHLAALYDGSYMIVNGKRIDNLRRLKPEIEKSLIEAEQIENLMTADDAARNAELDIINAMPTEEERERIMMLIKE